MRTCGVNEFLFIFIIFEIHKSDRPILYAIVEIMDIYQNILTLSSYLTFPKYGIANRFL